jgi:hypothetical protein
MNKDQALRDSIIGVTDSYHGGCAHYNNLTLEKLQKLIDNDFIEMDEAQNEAPTIEEFYNFLKKYPKFTVHGYVVEKERDDYRVSIEGLEYKGKITFEMEKDFTEFCKHADDLICKQNKLYSWYD